MVYDVERAIRFIRHNASRWDAQPNRIALIGGSAGGFLSNMVGLLNLPGDPSAAAPVDCESAQVQAVVTLCRYSISPLTGRTFRSLLFFRNVRLGHVQTPLTD
jgi:acetyl esterase/lipase